MTRVLVVAALLFGLAGEASAAPVDFSNRTDRDIFLTLFPDIPGIVPFEVFLAFDGDRATTRLEPEVFGPGLELLLGMATPPIVPLDISPYLFAFDGLGPSPELTASFGFRTEADANIPIPINFANVVTTTPVSLGTKFGLLFPGFPAGGSSAQLLCDPAMEVCLTETFTQDYDPLTGDIVAVGSTTGGTVIGDFKFFLEQPLRLEEIPEPTSLALLLGSLVALATLRRKSKS